MRENGTRTSNAAQQLTSEILDMPPRERLEIILLEEIVDTHAQQFGYNANMILVIELFNDMYALTVIVSYQYLKYND